MAVESVILVTNPAQPVPFSQKAVEKVLAESYLIADTKKDGVQLNLCVKAEGWGHWLSRAGKYLPALEYAAEESGADFRGLLNDDMCIYPDGFMLQAEIVTPGQPAEVTAGNLRRKSKPTDLESIEVHVFAVLPLSFVDSTDETFPVTNAVMKYHVEAMAALLQKHVPQIKWVVIESLDVFDVEELEAVYEMRRTQGEEGLVLKDPNALYRRGKRVGQWKMKPDDTLDGTVCGLVWGTKGLANEGKVIGFEVLLECGAVVNACGLTQRQKDQYTLDVISDYLGRGLPHWPEPEDLQRSGANPFQSWAVEVAFMERYKDGNLRHPTFNRWRGIADPLTKE